MACCGSMPPRTAPTTGSAAAALVIAVAGAPSSSRVTMVAIISTWPISSVATSMITSLYLPGIRHHAVPVPGLELPDARQVQGPDHARGDPGDGPRRNDRNHGRPAAGGAS